MEKIRIKNKGAYIIEVNDNGDTITLDMNDAMLPIKLINMMKDIEEKEKEFKEKADELMKKPDEPVEELFEGLPVTKNFLEYHELLNGFCNTCRGYIDNLFGKGASQKIFGDVNNIDMFADFFVQIQPHIQKAGLSLSGAKKNLAKKYMQEIENEGVI